MDEVTPVFAGSAHEVGLAKGRALGHRLAENIDRYEVEFRDADDKFTVDVERLRTGALPWLRTLPPRFQDEFEGMAVGADLALQRVAEWFFIEQCAVMRCSSAVVRVDGHLWVARNNDTVAPAMWGHREVRRVDGRIPTLTFGREGDIFVPTGVNADRLWLHYNALPALDQLDEGTHHIPPFVAMADMLETCSTVAEVEAALAAGQRSDGMLLFAVDGTTDSAAIFECGHRDVHRRPFDGDERWLVGTNHYCSIPDPSGDLDADQPGNTLSRYNRLEQMLTEATDRDGLTMPEDLVAMLGDPEVERRGATFATVHAVVACPATGDLHYTTGGHPAASQGRWRQIDWPF